MPLMPDAAGAMQSAFDAQIARDMFNLVLTKGLTVEAQSALLERSYLWMASFRDVGRRA